MNTVLRKSDGAMVVRWIPGFSKGKGILDAVNSGKGVASDLEEIETTDEEYMDNWYNREPREAELREALITAKATEIQRAEAVAALKANGELPDDYKEIARV